MNIKKDDTVQVITGKDKGKKGKVRDVHPSSNAVIVEGLNIVKKHTKGSAGARQAGVIEQEALTATSPHALVTQSCPTARRCAYAATAARHSTPIPHSRSGADAASITNMAATF